MGLESVGKMDKIISSLRFRDLYYLVTLAKEQNFSRAAERCSVSQPALSNQIRKLEELLGVKIFDRNSRNVRITRKGYDVIFHAKQLLTAAQQLSTLQDPLVESPPTPAVDFKAAVDSEADTTLPA
ncbi:MAG: DNA-binding transcriptional LysR family regulator [Kiritimatiellia bacterium]|jgi:LysR family transcriptional regulator, hydrogen peroxide-inducible genes activator